MKSIIKLLPPVFMVAALLATLSCKKHDDPGPNNPVDTTHHDTTHHDSTHYWSSSAQLADSLNATYALLRSYGFNEGLFPILDIMTEDARKGSNPLDNDQNIGVPFERFGVTPTNPSLEVWYATLFQGVFLANAVVRNAPKVSSLSPAMRSRTIGEARLLRALFYLDLVRAFGRVPMEIRWPRPASMDSIRQVADTVIYNHIILPDLLAAIDSLPERAAYGGDDRKRGTRSAARGLLARAALYIGGVYKFGMNTDAQFAANQFNLAREQTEAIIHSGLFGLEADFSNAFRPQGEFGMESVFEIPARGAENLGMLDMGGNQYGNVQGVRGNPNRGWGFKRPSMVLIRAFEVGDSRKDKTIIRLGETLDGIFIGGDASTPDYFINNGSVFDEPYFSVGDTAEIECFNQKCWTPGSDVASAFGYHRRLIRYADVLLMAADAQIESGGNPGLATQYINLVRARARGGDPTVLPNVGPSTIPQLREALFHERRMELALEDCHYFDLVRTGRAANYLAPYGFVAGKHEHMPIPQAVINAAQGRIIQNPGY